jgi:hypothetical protein
MTFRLTTGAGGTAQLFPAERSLGMRGENGGWSFADTPEANPTMVIADNRMISKPRIFPPLVVPRSLGGSLDSDICIRPMTLR